MTGQQNISKEFWLIFFYTSLRNYTESHLYVPSFEGQLMTETVVTGKATSKSLSSTSVTNCY